MRARARTVGPVLAVVTGVAWTLAMLCQPACGNDPGEVRHQAEVREWRSRREANLRKPDGWLALAGLFWLQEGENTLGSAASCTCRFPVDRAPARIGTFALVQGRVEVQVAEGVDVRCRGERVTRLQVDPAEPEGKTLFTLGSLTWYVMRRGERVGIRLKDAKSPLLTSFPGLAYYPVRAQWRIPGTFEPCRPPRKVRVMTAAGVAVDETVLGTVAFTWEGRPRRLEVFGEPGDAEGLIVFKDATSGRGTYPGGRFLQVARADADGRVTLDFNRAYNPPCAFTPYATCTLPPRCNHLDMAVEAGEKGQGH